MSAKQNLIAVLACAAAAVVATAAQAQGVKTGKPPAEVYAGIIVKYKSAAPVRATATSATTMRAVEDRARVKIAGSRAGAMDLTVYRFDKVMPAAEARAAAARIALDPNVEYAVPDQVMRRLQVTPNDTDYAMRQWDLQAPPASIGGANLPLAWQRTTGSNTVVVAVVDTGIRPGHPDLAGRLLPGYDFISSDAFAALGFPANWNAADGNGRDNDPTDPGDFVDATLLGQLPANSGVDIGSSSWHGTHVAGTIGAASNNNVGIAGIDWNARILPVRVLGRAGGTTSDIVDGMAWAVGLAVPGVPNNPTPARIINLSLGGPGVCSAAFQDVINRVRAAGGIVVAAAGNDGGLTVSQPANCTGVIAVTAHARDGDNASYANVGSEVAVSAPGGGCGSLALLDRDVVQGNWNTTCAGCHNIDNIRNQISSRARPGGAAGVLNVVKAREALDQALLGTDLSGTDTNMEVLVVSQTARAEFAALLANPNPAITTCFGPTDRIRSTVNLGTTVPAQEGYADYQGTSMASPHVAGVAALLLSLEPKLTSDEVKSILQSSARPHPANTYCATAKGCGTGLLDANAALTYLINNRPTVSAALQGSATGARPSAPFTLIATVKTTNGRTAPSSAITWRQTSGPAVTLASNTGAAITMTAPSATGKLGFAVTIVDSGGYTASSTVEVLVNTPPALQPVAPLSAKKGEAATGNVRATDTENDSITYVLVSGPPGLQLNAATGAWTWTPPTTGTYNVTVMATDPYGSGAQQSFTVTVADEKSGGVGSLPLGVLVLLLPALLRRRRD